MLTRVLIVVLSLRSLAHAEPLERGWLSCNFGFGGGVTRFGPINAAAELAGTYWLRDSLGATLLFRGYASGEPDGRGADGSVIAANVSVRHAWTSSHHGRAVPARVFASVGLGLGHHDGYDSYHQQLPFDRYGPAWTATSGVVMTPQWLIVGMQVSAYGFDGGFSVVPMFVLGATL